MENYKNEREWLGNTNQAIGITRVSTQKQKDNSPHVQRSEIADYCAKNGLDLVECIEIVESAKDHEERKKYGRAIDTAIKKRIRHIVFYMTDREGRNFTDIENNQRLIKKDVIVCHYAKDNKFLWKKSSQADFMMRQFQALQDKQVSEIISVKVNDAMVRKAESGWYPGNHPPLGYVHKYNEDGFGRVLKRGTTIVRDPNEKKVRQLIREYELCAEGYSVAVIREQILKEGLIPPSEHKKYSKHGIEARLRNPFYRGSFIWQDKSYPGKHELIVPRSLIDIVDSRFGHKKIRRKETEEKGIFSGGWLRCGHPECGLQITCEHTRKTIKASKIQKEFRYYRCSNSRGVHKVMKGMYISEEKLLKSFEPVLDKVSITAARAQEIADALNETEKIARRTIENEMNQFRSALTSLSEKRMKYLDLYAEKSIRDTEFRLKLEQLDEDQAFYTKQLEEAQYKISDAWKVSAETVLELAKEAKELWKKGSLTEKLEILKKICWNPILDGATLRYGLKKPFATLAAMNEKDNWRPHVEEFRKKCSEVHGVPTS